MDSERLQQLAHALDDVELAVLLCLVARRHCILTATGGTATAAVDGLQAEVEAIAVRVFDLLPVTVHCRAETTLDELVGGLLASEDGIAVATAASTAAATTAATTAPTTAATTATNATTTPTTRRTPSASSRLSADPVEPYARRRSGSRATTRTAAATAAAAAAATAALSDPFASSISRKRIANVVVLRGLETAGLHVQALVLELIRTRRVATCISVLEAPERFLVVVLLPSAEALPALLKHLRAHFFISHHRAPPDAQDRDQDQGQGQDHEDEVVHSSADSLASVVVRKPATPQPQPQSQPQPPQLQPQLLPLVRARAFVPLAVVDDIRARAGDVAISSEIRRYLLDIVVFLRMHRAVKSGLTAQATIDFEVLVKCLAPLHGLDFATPALVSLAVFKVYSHRIQLVARAQDERSVVLRWGSAPEAVAAYLAQLDVETVIDDVLASVQAPV